MPATHGRLRDGMIDGGGAVADADSAADAVARREALRDCAQAEAYVASICFKHGPPSRVGVELEWPVHHRDDPRRPLDTATLRAALGEHAPGTLDPSSPHHPLPSGALITVEPGGQVEISSLPQDGLAALIAVTETDVAFLTTLLAAAGLELGSEAMDRHRPSRRLLRVPRYAAMEAAYQRIGPDGLNMMCRTAGLQVCLDAGTVDQYHDRWSAACRLGPTMLALFANSRGQGADGTWWRSHRMRTLFGTDPARTRPAPITGDPARAWARRVLHTSVMCVRREHDDWSAPDGLTFADWIRGALPSRPTVEDLDYHLTTFFPPVRPRGYLEIRYLDEQPGEEWIVPLALLTALFSDHATVRAAIELTAEGAHRWVHAAKNGLADPVLAHTAREVVALARPRLTELDLPARIIAFIEAVLRRRLGERWSLSN